MALYLEIHAIQTVAPSNINRDDTGAPKTALFGGVKRLRVASQAWKHAMRDDFKTRFNAGQLGIRSTGLLQTLTEAIAEAHPEISNPQAAARTAFATVGIKLVEPKKGSEDSFAKTASSLFLGVGQVRGIAQAATEAWATGDKLSKAEQNAVKELFNANHAVDVALFGRMIASDKSASLAAASQVAHALGVSKMVNEFDFFSTTDDLTNDDAASMLGTIEYSSSTLYRYANINLDLLAENLGSTTAAQEVATKFVDSFITSMPTGKQTTFANRTLPAGVVITIRTDQPVSLAAAFEKPVTPTADQSVTERAAHAFVQHAQDMYDMYGNTPTVTLVSGAGAVGDALSVLGSRHTIQELPSLIMSALKDIK